MLKKIFFVSFQRIIEVFTHKFVISSQKYWFRIRDPEKILLWIPDPGPGVKKAPDPGYGSATLLKSEDNWIFSYTWDLPPSVLRWTPDQATGLKSADSRWEFVVKNLTGEWSRLLVNGAAWIHISAMPLGTSQELQMRCTNFLNCSSKLRHQGMLDNREFNLETDSRV